MTTKLYTLEIPLRFAVEANTWVEARNLIMALHAEVMAELPAGVGCFAKEAEIIGGIKQA
jgi:hypothetical protein